MKKKRTREILEEGGFLLVLEKFSGDIGIEQGLHYSVRFQNDLYFICGMGKLKLYKINDAIHRQELMKEHLLEKTEKLHNYTDHQDHGQGKSIARSNNTKSGLPG